MDELEQVIGGTSWQEMTPDEFMMLVTSMTDAFGIDIAQSFVRDALGLDKQVLNRSIFNNNYTQYWYSIMRDIYGV